MLEVLKHQKIYNAYLSYETMIGYIVKLHLKGREDGRREKERIIMAPQGHPI